MSQPNGNENRLDRIERLLESLAQRQEVQHVNIESLHASASELHAASQRHEAAIAQLIEAATRDGANIAALARIAEAHERRLTDLEGDEA